jgi:predicted nucleic acid-binding protein
MKIRPNRYGKQDISSISGKKVFFDANIMIYIFWPLYSVPHYTNQYSNIFGQLIKQENSLFINNTVLSEIINRIARIEHKCYCDMVRSPVSFKDYRNSSDGQAVFRDIFNILLNNILNNFGIGNKIFTPGEIKSLLVVDTLDYNDKLIVSECKENNYLLITNDGDYKNADIDIITLNHNLLSP